MSSVRLKLICRLVLHHLLGSPLNSEKLSKLTSSVRLHFSPADVQAILALIQFIYLSAIKHSCSSQILLAELQQFGLPKDGAIAITKEYEMKQEKLKKKMIELGLTLKKIGEQEEERSQTEEEERKKNKEIVEEKIKQEIKVEKEEIGRDGIGVGVERVEWRVEQIIASSRSRKPFNPTATTTTTTTGSGAGSDSNSSSSVSSSSNESQQHVRLNLHLTSPAEWKVLNENGSRNQDEILVGSRSVVVDLSGEQLLGLLSELKAARAIAASVE